jgi:hypothetical protein
MPCYRCGTRQVDPERGKSPWKRGVLREHQVLICPACQSAADADLDRCARCGSKHLIRRLDQVECLDCRLIREAELESALPGGTSPGAASASGGGFGGGGDPSGGDPSDSGASGSGASGSGASGSGASGSGAARGSAKHGPREGAAPGRQGSDPALAAEVARALEKVLGRR